MPCIYDEPTVRFSIRISRDHRRIINWLAAKQGISESAYHRQLVEAHIADLHLDPPPDG
jgi:hypothetical protein